MKLIHNAIIKAKFYRAGEDIPKEIVPPQLRKYEAKESKEPAEPKEINLMYKHNQAYSVDADGFLRPPVQRQMAEMQAEADEADAIEEEIEAPLDETTAAALEQAQDDYQADVSRQVAQARYAAEHADQAEEAVRAEQDADVGNGEFNEYDSPPKIADEVGSGPTGSEGPTERTVRKAKRQVPSSKSFVKRNGKFVPVATVELVPGESLFRFRPRSMGVAAKYIAFAKVKGESK